MSGMAGTGKTTIAYSFCEQLAKNGMLGASFFCSRSLAACSDIQQIFPTIAYQLSHSCPPIASKLLEILKKDISAPLLQQFEELILMPVKAGMQEGDEILIIVVDALDECTDINAVRDFLMVIGDHPGVGDLPIKIFITSRPEPVVQKTIETQLSDSSVFYLHNVEHDLVQADIKCYIEAELSQIAVDFDLAEQGWPMEAEVNSLVKHADRLFIYAATAIRYIGQTNGDPQVRLHRMITSHSISSSSLKTKVLDDLYKAILQLSYHQLELEEKQAICLVLGTIINVRNPLTINGLATLLHLTVRKVRSALTSLHSVVSVPSTQEGYISTFHASFPDFLKDCTRCGSDYYLNSLEYHQTLAAHSLRLINELLRENICDLDKQLVNADVPYRKIATHIHDGLAYACIYWVSHFKASNDTKHLQSELDHMFDAHILHWFECLSLLGQLDVGYSLRHLIPHVSVSDSKLGILVDLLILSFKRYRMTVL
jgi:NACHT domain